MEASAERQLERRTEKGREPETMEAGENERLNTAAGWTALSATHTHAHRHTKHTHTATPS